jgi:hypothetical protein
LEGQRLVLYALGEWPGASQAMPIEVARGLPGFEVLSAEQGAFRFEFPAPPGGACLIAGFAPLWTQKVLLFGGGQQDSLPALEVGVRELGDLVLLAASAIEGRVLSRAGQPLAGARLRSSSVGWDTLGQDCVSDAQGGFVLGGIQVQRAGVSADAEGHQSAFVGPFELTPGRFYGPIEVHLEPGLLLEGRVVGPQGEPLAGAKIDLLPRGGNIVSAESGPDGRFEATLLTAGTHSLVARLHGYRAIDLGQAMAVLPGEPVEVVLQPQSWTEFLVRDALTGQPIERFSLEIEPGQSGWFLAERVESNPGADPDFHAQGRVHAQSAVGDRVWVQAAGYANLGQSVTWLSPEQPLCILQLEPFARLKGQVWSQQAAIVGARLQLRTGPDAEAVKLLSGEQGRFEFADLAPGSYQLDLKSSAGVLCRRDIRLAPAETLDLGRLQPEAPGSLQVRLLPPPGQSAAGLVVDLVGPAAAAQATTDPEGLAHFADLPSGIHRVDFKGIAQRLAAANSGEVKIEPGAEARVEIDLAPLSFCRVEVQLHGQRLGNAPLLFHLRSAVGLEPTGNGVFSSPDPTGLWVAFAYPHRTSRVCASIQTAPSWLWQGPQIQPSPGGLIQERFDLPAAELLLQWEEAPDWPTKLTLELSLTLLEAPAGQHQFLPATLIATLPFNRHQPGPLAESAAELFASGQLLWSALPPGRFRTQLRLTPADSTTPLRSSASEITLPQDGRVELRLR